MKLNAMYFEFPKHLYHPDPMIGPVIAHNSTEEAEYRANGYVSEFQSSFYPKSITRADGAVIVVNNPAQEASANGETISNNTENAEEVPNPLARARARMYRAQAHFNRETANTEANTELAAAKAALKRAEEFYAPEPTVSEVRASSPEIIRTNGNPPFLPDTVGTLPFPIPNSGIAPGGNSLGGVGWNPNAVLPVEGQIQPMENQARMKQNNPADMPMTPDYVNAGVPGTPGLQDSRGLAGSGALAQNVEGSGTYPAATKEHASAANPTPFPSSTWNDKVELAKKRVDAAQAALKSQPLADAAQGQAELDAAKAALVEAEKAGGVPA
jgi:hypothetical protein